jgi:hypothetical protein
MGSVDQAVSPMSTVVQCKTGDVSGHVTETPLTTLLNPL